MKIRNKAFTLAETLVVMGIIGVIAALTIPNLSQSTDNRERVTKVKKIYSEMNEALDRATAVYGPLDTWGWDPSSDVNRNNLFGGRITEFLKISKACKPNDNCTEFSDVYGSETSYRIVMPDGTRLVMGVYGADGSGDHVVLTNKTGKCKLSVDYHGFVVSPGTNFYFEPRYLRSAFSTILNQANYCRFEFQPGDLPYCNGAGASWMILYDNADYLKLDKNKKCPNGTTPTESNPRCN